jgi:hypothetical protein
VGRVRVVVESGSKERLGGAPFPGEPGCMASSDRGIREAVYGGVIRGAGSTIGVFPGGNTWGNAPGILLSRVFAKPTIDLKEVFLQRSKVRRS